MSDILKEILNGATPSMEEIVRRLGERLPLLHDLEGTDQDAEWHAEGNVLIHTGMVLDEAYQLLKTDLAGWPVSRRAALVLGAALHDIAKPLTTREREIDGRIRLVCPHHEQMGRSYLALQLAGELAFPPLETVMALTGYHNRLKKLVLRDHSSGDYRKLGRLVDLELIYWLEVADIRGRECPDKDKQLEHLDMFRMFAEEYGLWHQDEEEPWREKISDALSDHPGATLDLVMAKSIIDREQSVISTPEEAIARSYSYRDAYPEVVLTVGLSGSGKTTWIQKHLDDHQLISLDDIRSSLSRREDQQNNAQVVRIAKEKLRVHLRAKEKIVWDATSLRSDFRSAIIDLALDYGALITIVALHCPLELLAKRNKTRGNPVPAGVRLKQVTGTQWPQLSEAHRFLDVDGEGKLLAAHGCPGGLPYNLKAQA